jgi:hypothetical protein
MQWLCHMGADVRGGWRARHLYHASPAGHYSGRRQEDHRHSESSRGPGHGELCYGGLGESGIGPPTDDRPDHREYCVLQQILSLPYQANEQTYGETSSNPRKNAQQQHPIYSDAGRQNNSSRFRRGEKQEVCPRYIISR